jgi:hypothetical protein
MHDLIYQFFGLNSQDLRLARWLSSTHDPRPCGPDKSDATDNAPNKEAETWSASFLRLF